MRTTVLDFVVAGERRIPCAACEERIGIVLRRLPGVEKAEAST